MDEQIWRLIINAPSSGLWNMAVDEAILESVAKSYQPPTLRLYAWKPYCLSLGHAQPITDIDIPEIKAKRWDLVRRPTGGRAILHADELTYAVITLQTNPIVSGTVIESYRRISSALLTALNSLGLNATSETNTNSHGIKIPNPVCFETPSDYELTYHNKKIIGSAQARKLGTVLQHGAIPLFGDITRIIEVLNFDDQNIRNTAKRRLQMRAASLQQVINRDICWKDVAKALVYGFTSTFNINLIPGYLSLWEREKAKYLMNIKYSDTEWTYRI